MTDIQKVNEEAQEVLVLYRRRKRLIIAAIILVVVAIICGVMWSGGFNSAQDKAQKLIEKANTERDDWRKLYEDLKNKPLVVEPVRPEIVMDVLSQKTDEISELASAEYFFTNSARFTDTAHIIGIFDWMTKKSFVQKWDGKIKAGVKLDRVKVSVSDTVITIALPNAEILSYEVDYDSVEVLDEKNNIFNPISVDDKNNFDKESKAAMIERAIDNGLLDKANNNAKNIVANLLGATVKNIENYSIEFIVLEEDK